MAERRMLTKKVTDDDHFLGLSSSAQALYLHLTMNADDDGFCNQVSASMFKAHASVQDLHSLLENRYIYQFDNGVIVIKHWRMANALRKDRYTQTSFRDELAKLRLEENGSYTWLPSGCQVVAERLPQNRLDKNSIDKSNRGSFTPPTIEEVQSYCKERGSKVDPQTFLDYYSSQDWKKSNGQKLKDWKAAVRLWESRDQARAKGTNFQNFEQRTYSEDLEDKLVNRRSQ